MEKLCIICNNKFIPNYTYQKYCSIICKKTARKNHNKESYHRNITPEKLKQYNRNAKQNFIQKNGIESLHNRDNKVAKKHNDKVRFDVINHYSNGTNKCICCGESIFKFLTIDHINNNGAEERRKLFKNRIMGGSKFYHWLKKNNYPEGYQVMCWNCNCGKRMNNGICPHKGCY